MDSIFDEPNEPPLVFPGPMSGNSGRLWQRSSFQRIATGAGSVLVVMIFGILGYVYNGWSWFDALFMVVITISGVGFGEVRPLASTGERIHTMMVIGFGLLAMAYTVAGFVQYLTEGEIRNYLGQQRMRRQIAALTGHTRSSSASGGWGLLVAEELMWQLGSRSSSSRQTPTASPTSTAAAIPYVGGDGTEEETLFAPPGSTARENA